jgi:hypothetical protein
MTSPRTLKTIQKITGMKRPATRAELGRAGKTPAAPKHAMPRMRGSKGTADD